MSDSIEDLAKHYNKNVCEHPRSIGLFTIPEYPELEAERGMWSTALDALLTTLRYLAPATLITLFWGQQSFLFKILKHIDSAFRAIVFSSEEQKEEVLQWLADAGSVKVEHLETVWRHGWILCGVLDGALPGACAGHSPTRLSIDHAQAIAHHYLAVEPVFSRQELESNTSLSKHQEWKLVAYLECIRQALSKLGTPASKPIVERNTVESTPTVTHNNTLDYVAKGSGLLAAQVNNSAHFKIYPTAQQTMEPGEITILIRGPKDTYGMAVIPPILGKAQMIRHKLMGMQSQQNYTENILPITQGATYLRSYGKNDMNKTYYIPKSKYDIDISVQFQIDHAKVCYTANIEGKYEISITSRGQNIVGSPYTVTVSHNIVNIFERDSYYLEDGEEIDIVDVKTDRKVVLRIVDFVTEKMLLKENGTLEKITDDEAKFLMTTDIVDKDITNIDKTPNDLIEELNDPHNLGVKFSTVAQRILRMNRVCKRFNHLLNEKEKSTVAKIEDYKCCRNQQDIPDIVNSTLFDSNTNQYVIPEKRDKYIVPENITVSLTTEKSIPMCDKEINNTINDLDNDAISVSTTIESTREANESFDEQSEDNLSIGRLTPISTTNPFIHDMCEDNFVEEKSFGTFVTSEYETNNSQNEETRESSITIVIDPNATPTPTGNNPFMDALVDCERPKTPVFKIISGEKLNREGSVFLEQRSEFGSGDNLSNAFINPFFMHHHQKDEYTELPVTDFIIGAPVSLPPVVRSSTPEPAMKSLIITGNEHANRFRDQSNIYKTRLDVSEDVQLSPIENIHDHIKTGNNSTEYSTFHTSDFENLANTDNSKSSITSDTKIEELDIISEQSSTSKKDTWDSAYVSIDDNNISPDTNNNENTILCETHCKQKTTSTDGSKGFQQEEICNMGPAEKELWQTCSDLSPESNKNHEEMKPYKCEVKRPIFTPIMEESDKSISLGMKDLVGSDTGAKQGKSETVSVAFAELNDIYQEYYPDSEATFSTVANEDEKDHSTEVETTDFSVDSASEISDVKRHDYDLEGKTSEVQANVTESVSVSQTLRNYMDDTKCVNPNNDETQFGDIQHNNIVLEKKKYWDERIRLIEAKSAESTVITKKKRISSKQLKHNDSLSKRRGKQMIKQFLNSGDYSQVINNSLIVEKGYETNSREEERSVDKNQPDKNLVEKWKKYWDDKLESEYELLESEKNKSKTQINITLKGTFANNKTNNEIKTPENRTSEDLSIINESPVKKELLEEVFKAFETSPKRFFGTSRKRILNKIDTFLGKPEDSTTTEVNRVCHETGLVSSRISLFHNISNSEELPWAKRKSQSLHNIYPRRENENSDIKDDTFRSEQCKSTQPEVIREYKNDITLNTDGHTEIKYDSLNAKRTRITRNINNISFDDADQNRKSINLKDVSKKVEIVCNELGKNSDITQTKTEILRRKSFSKSEMDIFSKISHEATDDLDKYRSCDELPKTNVKSFISLYENVTKIAEATKPTKRIHRTTSVDSQKLLQPVSTTSDAVHKAKATSRAEQRSSLSTSKSNESTPVVTPSKRWTRKKIEPFNTSFDTELSYSSDVEIIDETSDNKQTTYLSLSDIELEIVECSPEKSSESSPERTIDTAHIDYKSRFKSAKEYFKSLEELREIRTKKTRKLNECEILLRKQSTESLEAERPQKRVKKNIKSHSMPSSEISKIWDQLQESQGNSSNTKLVKISEKFNVDDLFTDVMEGRLSRQGSLRGIPHKKAVLEAFRSMENISDNKLNSYEIAESQIPDFAIEHRVQNAQTYLTEYPYLPTTDPSKFHSRLDEQASGLISYKELLKQRPRRNSVPDLRLNTKFTEDL